MPDTSDAPQPRLADIPRGVWALGIVSLLMDVSSEMIHALLPVFLVTTMGATPVWVGLIEGIAEATASITKVFSGVLSDWLGKRKWLAVIGYGLGALTKPIFPLASSIGWLVAARFIDRVGKGIRGAPRDALVADIAPDHLRGASFGLRQSLDTAGAVIGPLLAVVFMLLLDNEIQLVFWLAVLPAILSVAVLIFGVREPERHVSENGKAKIDFSAATRLGGLFWAVTFVGTVLTFARFSEAFLVLKAQDAGMALAFIPFVLVVMNVIYAFSALPAGLMSDRIGRKGLLAIGIVLLIVADLILAVAGSIPATLAGVVVWGLHMGMTQGLLSTLVADAAPAELRGTAFGVFNLFLGLAMLVASLLAGSLWQMSGPAATFLAGAGFSAVALFGLLLLPTSKTGNRRPATP